MNKEVVVVQILNADKQTEDMLRQAAANRDVSLLGNVFAAGKWLGLISETLSVEELEWVETEASRRDNNFGSMAPILLRWSY